MDENLPVIRISVRNLVEFILREGDIDNRTGGGQDPENMQMGSRIHRQTVARHQIMMIERPFRTLQTEIINLAFQRKYRKIWSVCF